jgi:hypothetical protein
LSPTPEGATTQAAPVSTSATAPEGPADHSQAAAETAETETYASRPYPGSGGVKTAAAKISPTTFTPAFREEPAETVPGHEEAVATQTDSGVNSVANRTPSMSPPLRRRSQKKKRGFWKRLFGIK